MSSLSAYNYESTASARPLHRQESPNRPLRVLPGSGKHAATLSPTFLLAAKIIAVAVVVLAALSFARIALNSATVVTTLESQKISASVDSARSEASALEIQQSALASPDRIKREAAAIGMAAPVDTQILTLEPDIVAVTDTGALSLSGSTRQLASLTG